MPQTLPSNKASVAIVVYAAMLNSCFLYAVVLWFSPSFLGEKPLVDDETVLWIAKLAFLAMSVPMLVAGNLVANLGIAPKGWERDQNGWRRAEERLKGNDEPDSADAFYTRSFTRLLLSGAMIESVATLGMVLGLLGADQTRSAGFALIALGTLSFIAIMPRAFYVKSATEAIAAIESDSSAARP